MKNATQRTASLLILLVAGSTTLASPEIPGTPQDKPLALVGGTLHPVSGPVIPVGTLLFDEGRIVALGTSVDIPAGTKRINISGKHVYPSLFDANTRLGLTEINSVRATRDAAETGTINSNVKAQVAVNPDSELIPVARSNGVLLALSSPNGGLICGTSAVLQLDGWTWEDMTLKGPAGMHVNWPRMSNVGSGSGSDVLRTLRQVFVDSRAYSKAKQAADENDAPSFDARLEAMLPVLAGRLPLIVSANDLQRIQAAVAFAQQEGVKLIIFGGYDAPHCADLLKKHNVPIIVGGTWRLPMRRWEAYDTPLTVAARLHKAGVKFCISESGRDGATAVRNLPYHAATAAAYGLPRDAALKAVTLYPAQILGVADRVGSLEVGKDATLIITDGDPLETPTHVLSAYIQGRAVDLSDRHKRLNAKYQEKYRRLGLNKQGK